MAWQWEICLLIIIGIMMTLLVFVVLSWIFLPTIWAFEITNQMKKDETTVQMCIMYNINSTECVQVYGGVPENSKGSINDIPITNNGGNNSGY